MENYFGLLDLSTPDLIIILAIILVLFGGKKIPELTRGIGESLNEFKKGLGSEKDKNNKKTDEKHSSNQNKS